MTHFLALLCCTG